MIGSCVRRASLLLITLTVVSAFNACTSIASTAAPGSIGNAPPTLFLTWQSDPTTTMTAQWLEVSSDDDPLILYTPEGSPRWTFETGEREDFGGDDWDVCRVEITGLEPGTRYNLRVGDGGETFTFQTMPATLDESINFVSGGDAGPSEATRRICELAAARDPELAVIGGDIAYADGRRPHVWVSFLEIWHETMRTSDGRLIPMVTCIGNHEVIGGFAKTRAEAPLFLALFKLFDERSYESLDFGNYMSFVLPDSWHTTPIEGEQTTWLRSALEERDNRPHLFVFYHMPIYPSHRALDSREGRQRMRELWPPLFEEFDVDCVFEHDDHTYKRTPRIRDGAIHEEGIVYIGDGCWGVGPRSVKSPQEEWYLETSAAKNHFIETIITPEHRTHIVVDAEGEEFDRFESTVDE